MSISELKRRLAEFKRTKLVLDEAIEDDELSEGLRQTEELLELYAEFLDQARKINPDGLIKYLQWAHDSANEVRETEHAKAVNDAWAVVNRIQNLVRER